MKERRLQMEGVGTPVRVSPDTRREMKATEATVHLCADDGGDEWRPAHNKHLATKLGNLSGLLFSIVTR